jgi:predicted thioesterase
MKFDKYIQPGMTNETTFMVEEKHTAVHVGSGTLRVLASPVMITFMERVSRQLLDKHLPKGYSNVGIHVDIRHIAPSPMGANVLVKCEVIEVDGIRVSLKVQAKDEQEVVGEGNHKRVVINVDRFLRRVKAKANKPDAKLDSRL